MAITSVVADDVTGQAGTLAPVTPRYDAAALTRPTGMAVVCRHPFSSRETPP